MLGMLKIEPLPHSPLKAPMALLQISKVPKSQLMTLMHWYSYPERTV